MAPRGDRERLTVALVMLAAVLSSIGTQRFAALHQNQAGPTQTTVAAH